MAILCRKIGSVRFLSNRLNYRKKLKYRLLKSIFHFLPIHSLLCIIVYIFRCVPYFARITSWSIVMFLTYEQLKIHFMSPKAATVKPVFPVVEKL